MYFRCLGGADLEGSGIKQGLPLLLLAYTVFSGKRLRVEIADLFWAHLDNNKKRSKIASEYFRKLSKELKQDISLDRKYVQVHLQTDVYDFEDAIKEEKWLEAIKLYKGVFFENIEREKRITIAEELQEWLSEKRQSLQSQFLRF